MLPNPIDEVLRMVKDAIADHLLDEQGATALLREHGYEYEFSIKDGVVHAKLAVQQDGMVTEGKLVRPIVPNEGGIGKDGMPALPRRERS